MLIFVTFHCNFNKTMIEFYSLVDIHMKPFLYRVLCRV